MTLGVTDVVVLVVIERVSFVFCDPSPRGSSTALTSAADLG